MRANLACRAAGHKVDLLGASDVRREGLAEDSEDPPAELVICDLLSIMGGGFPLTQGVATIVRSLTGVTLGVSTWSPSTGISAGS